MNRYMYLERIMQRTPIRAKNGEYQWKINGKSYPIPEYAERMLIYATYVGITGCTFFDLARKHLPKRALTNTDPELLKKTFRDDHHLIDLIEYDYLMIQPFASDGQGILVYGRNGDFGLYVNIEDEQRMLDLLKTSTNPYGEIKFELDKIARRYSIAIEDDDLMKAAKNFLMMHGADYEMLYDKEVEIKEIRKRELAAKNDTELKNTIEYASSEWEKQHHKTGVNYSVTKNDPSRVNTTWCTPAYITLLIIIIILWITAFCGNEEAGWGIPFLMATSFALPDVDSRLYIISGIIMELFALIVFFAGGDLDILGFVSFALPASLAAVIKRPLF